ncbi:hypothetical protein [Rhizobium sp. CIAT894]|uniref:hypothetical protein n=1 Tax=Rhizobium sp. CIAT894 TaxID=2020312 RepID=UPI00030578B1|nr:hypothetical protein [Rhizobium sp. CIAT894]
MSSIRNCPFSMKGMTTASESAVAQPQLRPAESTASFDGSTSEWKGRREARATTARAPNVFRNGVLSMLALACMSAVGLTILHTN